MGNYVSLAAGVDSTSISPDIAISCTSKSASPTTAVTTLPQVFLDFKVKTEDSPSPAFLQISTSISSKDIPTVSTSSPYSTNSFVEEPGGNLKRHHTEGSEVSGGLLQPRIFVAPKKYYYPAKGLPPMRGDRDFPNSPAPEKGVLSGPPESAVIVKKPIKNEDSEPAQKYATVQAFQTNLVSLPGKDSDQQAFSSQQLIPEHTVEPQNKFNPDEFQLKTLLSEKEAIPQQKPPIQKIGQSSTRHVSPEPTVALTLQPIIPIHPVQQNAAPSDTQPALNRIAQIPAQSEEENGVKDTLSAKKYTTQMRPGQVEKTAMQLLKGTTRIVYIPRNPIQLFGRPHVHYA
jgi:hypothetical protein